MEEVELAGVGVVEKAIWSGNGEDRARILQRDSEKVGDYLPQPKPPD